MKAVVLYSIVSLDEFSKRNAMAIKQDIDTQQKGGSVCSRHIRIRTRSAGVSMSNLENDEFLLKMYLLPY